MSLFSAPFAPEREAALVTGAGNGIGRAIAQALVHEGVRTVFADVREDTVQAAVASTSRPDLAIPWVGDLAQAQDREALLAFAQDQLGQVTHFVHSASPPRREVDHVLAVVDATWSQMRAVNIDAAFHLCRSLSKTLIQASQPGSFLILTSLHAQTPRNLPHYSTSKAALAMLVKELAKSLGRYGIRVNAVGPAFIETPLLSALPPGAKEALIAVHPVGRLGLPAEVAALTLFLLSDRASFVSGSYHLVDGGYTAQ